MGEHVPDLDRVAVQGGGTLGYDILVVQQRPWRVRNEICRQKMILPDFNHFVFSAVDFLCFDSEVLLVRFVSGVRVLLYL